MTESNGTSIRRRLLVGFMVTTGMALLLSSVAFATIEIVRFRGSMVRNLSTLAELIGLNTGPAMLFGDSESAQETLSALAAQRHVLTAIVYDARGEVFARYSRGDFRLVQVPERRPAGHEFIAEHLDLFQDIKTGGETLGTVFIRSDTHELRERFWQYFGIVVGLIATASLVSAYGASRLQRRIATPLAALANGSEEMAKGDLATRVEVSSRDEIGILARAFNDMAARLRNLVGQVGDSTRAVADAALALRTASDEMHVEVEKQEAAIEESAETIEMMSTSVQEVNASVEGLATTASETSRSVQHMGQSITAVAVHMDDLFGIIDSTASSVTQMSAAIREIAQSSDSLDQATRSTSMSLEVFRNSVNAVKANAEQNHALSEKAAAQAERGMRRVQETVQAMKKIETRFQGLEQIIGELADSSQSIDQIVKVIEGVLKETNLLSLNAAIISAHAGEQGRAFSVVARGVKNLAERTAVSTREIGALIDEVRASVGSAVAAMKAGSQDVEKGVFLSTEAGQMLEAIRESSAQSSNTVSEIAEATGLQAHDIQLVDEAMRAVAAIVQQLNRGTHEQDNARVDLVRSVERMRELGMQVKQATQEQRSESRLITGAVQIVATRVHEILQATAEQRKRGKQILQALQIFRQGATQGTLRAEDLKVTVGLLSERSKALEEEISRFQL